MLLLPEPKVQERPMFWPKAFGGHSIFLRTKRTAAKTKTMMTVRTSVAKSESTPWMPILAKIAVSAAKQADIAAQKNHPFWCTHVLRCLTFELSGPPPDWPARRNDVLQRLAGQAGGGPLERRVRPHFGWQQMSDSLFLASLLQETALPVGLGGINRLVQVQEHGVWGALR